MALVELSAEEKMVILLPFPRFLQPPVPLRLGKLPALVLYCRSVLCPLTIHSVFQPSSVPLSQTRLDKKVWNNPFIFIRNIFPKFAEYSSKWTRNIFYTFLEDMSVL